MDGERPCERFGLGIELFEAQPGSRDIGRARERIGELPELAFELVLPEILGASVLSGNDRALSASSDRSRFSFRHVASMLLLESLNVDV